MDFDGVTNVGFILDGNHIGIIFDLISMSTPRSMLWEAYLDHIGIRFRSRCRCRCSLRFGSISVSNSMVSLFQFGFKSEVDADVDSTRQLAATGTK